MTRGCALPNGNAARHTFESFVAIYSVARGGGSGKALGPRTARLMSAMPHRDRKADIAPGPSRARKRRYV
jgi:hypothetical protein